MTKKCKVQTISRDAETGQLSLDEKIFNPFFERNVKNPTTDCETLTHLLKACLGTGILSMPLAFKNSGLFVGIIGTLLVAFICTHCSYILVKCAHILYYRTRKTEMSFADVAETAFATGPEWGKKFAKSFRYFIELCLFVTYFGAVSVYTVIITENFHQVLVHYNPDTIITVRIMIVCLLIPLILLCWIPNLKYLAPVSMVANVLMGISIAITLYYLAIRFNSLSEVPKVGDIKNFPVFLSITVFAIEAIGVMMPLENNMKTPQNFVGIFGVLNKGMFGCALLYILLGFLGYCAFVNETKASITLNLPTEEIPAQVVKIFIGLAVFLTFGLQFYVCMDIIWSNIKNYFAKKALIANYVIRTILVTLAVLLAIAVPKIEALMGLIGAFCFTVLGLLIPVAIETITFWDTGFGTGNWMVFKNIIICIVSFIVVVAGSNSAITEIVKEYS